MRRIVAISTLILAAAVLGWMAGRFGGPAPPVSSGRRSGGERIETPLPESPDAHAPRTVGPAPGSSQPAPEIASWRTVEDFPRPIAVFQTVFWDPRDTISLRQLIRETTIAKGKRVLEIGTGSGLLALCCLQAGARHAVATDVNPAALRNAAFNARLLGLSDRLELRPVPLSDPEAYSVIDDSEKFDLIVSNPPWEEGQPASIDRYAFYDPQFQLLHSLLKGLPDHLTPGGKALLAYGSVEAVRTIEKLADPLGLQVTIRDDRELDALPDVFLPGMLLEVAPRSAENPPAASDAGASNAPPR